VKQTQRNSFILGTFALTCLQAGVGCSAENTGPSIGAGGTFSNTGTAGTPAASGSGNFTAPTSGSSSGGTATSSFGGTFGNAGTFSMVDPGTAGTATGGTPGAGGTGTAGTATGGTATGGTGAGATDFPANCPMPSTTAHGATPLTRTCWGAKASDCAKTADNMNPPTQAIDAAGIATRFATGAKMTASKLYTFDVDLGTAVMVNGVSVTSEAGKTDYAPQLEVAVSTDGTAFTSVACGAGAVTTDFAFTAVSARYVRFVQHGIGDAWWSIWDLNIYAATGDTCAGGGAQVNTCTTPHTQ
jgi:F5/8 type C domain